jgi:hypothetical protein
MGGSTFFNRDYDVVRIRFRTRGEENMRLFRSQSDRLKGPDGSTYKYAWKSRDEQIANNEFDQYSATGTYGTDVTFGSPPGEVP